MTFIVVKDGIKMELHDPNQVEAFLSSGWSREIKKAPETPKTEAAAPVAASAQEEIKLGLSIEEAKKLSYKKSAAIVKDMGINPIGKKVDELRAIIIEKLRG